jgi:ATP-dependent 26S proteasome regulatory subunit
MLLRLLLLLLSASKYWSNTAVGFANIAEARLKRLRDEDRAHSARFAKTEHGLMALQSVGQIIGDVLKRLEPASGSTSTDTSAERFIVKASSGPRYVVGCRARLNYDLLKPGTRVALYDDIDYYAHLAPRSGS